MTLRDVLLGWYRRHGRDLPWRRTRDPYRVWVSEVMLQQTTVATVLPRYGRLLARFPTIRALAGARRRDVLAAWSGLGYYRRAASLHQAAKEIVRRHGGVFPADPRVKLPGVGDYTRAAVLSIAYGVPVAAVDVNVGRVLSRLKGLEGGAGRPAAVAALAQRMLPARRPGDWTQALMDLGAMVCLPSGPRCPLCPLVRRCRASRQGLLSAAAGSGRARKPRSVRLDCSLCVRDGKVLLERRGAGLLAGHWGLPEGLPRSRTAKVLATVRHRITHHDVTLTLRSGQAPGRVLGASLRWVARSELSRQLVSSLWRKALAAVYSRP
ncbi:MAG: A/G-specific adenine glycosylase [Elusimicrobia bacterium]|nr:A/G-specific adenine glycosylase [Elusimicrobiota bacterium]